MSDSRVTPQAVQTAAAQLRATHWNGIGCGTYGASACSRCYGPSPADATEVAEEVLEAAAPLLCQPLQDEIDRLRAIIDAVEQQARLALIAGNPLAYSLRAVLAASPVGTGNPTQPRADD